MIRAQIRRRRDRLGEESSHASDLRPEVLWKLSKKWEPPETLKNFIPCVVLVYYLVIYSEFTRIKSCFEVGLVVWGYYYLREKLVRDSPKRVMAELGSVGCLTKNGIARQEIRLSGQGWQFRFRTGKSGVANSVDKKDGQKEIVSNRKNINRQQYSLEREGTSWKNGRSIASSSLPSTSSSRLGSGPRYIRSSLSPLFSPLSSYLSSCSSNGSPNCMSSSERSPSRDSTPRSSQNLVMNRGTEGCNATTMMFPAPGLPGASLFDGTNITEFIITWEDLTVEWVDGLKIKRVPMYCERSVGRYIRGLEGYGAATQTWESFRKLLLEEFKEGDEEQQRYTQSYLEKLAANLNSKGDRATPSERRSYIFEFSEKADRLVNNNVLSEHI